MIWRIKEILLYLRLKNIVQHDEHVRRGHWRYFRGEKTLRVKPCIVKNYEYLYSR